LPDVVIFTLDTTRADRLGAWGYAAAHTPTLDRLAQEGRRYASAWSPLPLTIPSHGALWTGLYPPRLDLRDNGRGRLTEDRDTLAEALHAAGYQTAASVAAFVTTRTWGFSQGFDAYFDDIPKDDENFWHGERPGSQVVDDALRWWAARDPHRPAFLWIHLYDAHFPYVATPEHLARAGGRPYDAELAYVDDQVARVVSVLDPARTVVAYVSDHGEGLGDHGELTHGLFVYPATQHVPWVLWGAGVTPGVVSRPVSLVDVTPTLLDHLGLAAPAGLDGVPVRTDADARPAVYMESWQLAQRFGLAPHLGLVDAPRPESGAVGPWQLIDTPRPELYDLAVEASLRGDVASSFGDEVTRLRSALAGWRMPPPGQTSSADPEAIAALEALGYVQGAVDISATASATDPKDARPLIELSQRAERAQVTRDLPSAKDALRELVAAYPTVVEFHNRLGQVLTALGDHEGAARELDAALALAPDNPQLQSARAARLARAGQLLEAAEMWRTIATQAPYTPHVRTLCLRAWMQAGQVDRARAWGEAWLLEHSDDLGLSALVGQLRVDDGDLLGGYLLLEAAWAAEPPELNVGWYLAARALGQGDLDGADAFLRRELSAHPENLRAWVGMARLCQRRGDWVGQGDAARKAVAGLPKDPDVWHLLVLALFNQGRFAEAREALDAGLQVDAMSPDLLLMDANLLVKEGKPDLGRERFEAASRALQARGGGGP
jgi:tetratricopeptide (TPR) repeat protein